MGNSNLGSLQTKEKQKEAELGCSRSYSNANNSDDKLVDGPNGEGLK